ncbi:MAG TPA: DUF5694 domain-containing protein [Gemmatimonadales bacterium]
MRFRTTAAALSLWACRALPADAQPLPDRTPTAPAQAEVLVLGVYHMASPGRDIFNMQADDVLAPKRQAEIAQVIAVLKRFGPTKIALEGSFSENRITNNYADYLAGKHELTRNETEQLGLRLARELGHTRVYPVDVDGEFPFQHVLNYAKASGRSEELKALMDETGVKVKGQGEYLASHTVLETLLYMNADDRVAEDVGSYYRLARFGEPWDWAGADLVSDWFRRNMRIYSNVMQLIESPNERVLVIFGAGHLGWLQRDFGSNPRLRVRRLAEFVK